MARTRPAPTSVQRLLRHLEADVADDLLSQELGEWLTESPRFRSFVDSHRDKIRKKLRGATDLEARRDVRAELAVAHALLTDRRVELAFEAYGSGRPGPDFTVSVRGERPFNLEVTRLHRAPSEAVHGGPLLTKLHQLPPSVPNALLIAIDGEAAETLDVAAATRALRALADAKDQAFFVTRGFAGTRAFYERYLRLGGVLVWAASASGDARVSVWMNRSARIALPERAVRACVASLRAS